MVNPILPANDNRLQDIPPSSSQPNTDIDLQTRVDAAWLAIHELLAVDTLLKITAWLENPDYSMEDDEPEANHD